DLGEAVKWFRAAAQQGHPRAEKILGYCYGEGIGVERNDAESVRWLKQAAGKDDPEAQYLLGLKYVHGVGVAADLEEAGRCSRLAAEWGETRAQYNLGVAYATGQGNPRDLVRAHLWFSLAASQANSEAKAAVHRLEPGMSKPQIDDAHRLREQWKPRKLTRPEGMPDWEWLARAPNAEEP